MTDDPLLAAYRQALQQWLAYDQRRVELTAELFTSRADSNAIQDLLDANEDLRRSALDATRKLLGPDKSS